MNTQEKLNELLKCAKLNVKNVTIIFLANVKGIFEGLYIARTDTYTLTHNVPSTIGIYCRTGEAAKEFEKSTLAKEELTNIVIFKRWM